MPITPPPRTTTFIGSPPLISLTRQVHHIAARASSPKLKFGGMARAVAQVGDVEARAGTVHVERHLYVPAQGSGKASCPLDLQIGMVEGQWTPLSAQLMARSMACMTAREAHDFFCDLGGMCPSTSSLDRIPKKLSEVCEDDRGEFEDELRSGD